MGCCRGNGSHLGIWSFLYRGISEKDWLNGLNTGLQVHICLHMATKRFSKYRRTKCPTFVPVNCSKCLSRFWFMTHYLKNAPTFENKLSVASKCIARHQGRDWWATHDVCNNWNWVTRWQWSDSIGECMWDIWYIYMFAELRLKWVSSALGGVLSHFKKQLLVLPAYCEWFFSTYPVRQI